MKYYIIFEPMAKKNTFQVSDSSTNSYGFKVRTAGIDLTEFNENPVMLLNHNYDKVIGNWVNQKVSGDRLLADPEFDMDDEEAVKIANKVEKGLIKGASIGITPVKWENDEVVECILKEISLTPLPSNKNSVRLYDQSGKMIPDNKAKEYLLSLNNTNENPNFNTMTKKMKLALIGLMTQLAITLKLSDSDSDEQFESALDEIKTAITLKDNKIQELTTQLKTEKDSKVKNLIDGAVTSGKIDKKDEAKWTERAERDFEMTSEVLNALQGRTDINLELSRDSKDDKAKDENNDERKGWTFDDYAEKDYKALELMESKDPTKYKALLDAKLKAVQSSGMMA